MNRRDFLALRVTPQGRTLELSCQSLYMQCVDAQVSEADSAGEHESWMGEPAAVWTKPSADELLARLEADLRGVQHLRVMESEWIESTSLGARLLPVLASFRARGGLVEYSAPRQA